MALGKRAGRDRRRERQTASCRLARAHEHKQQGERLGRGGRERDVLKGQAALHMRLERTVHLRGLECTQKPSGGLSKVRTAGHHRRGSSDGPLKARLHLTERNERLRYGRARPHALARKKLQLREVHVAKGHQVAGTAVRKPRCGRVRYRSW